MSAPSRLPIQAGGGYEVLVGAGLLPRLGALLEEAGLSGRVALIVDETVFSLWGERALSSLGDATVLRIPSGEAAKTLSVAERLWGELIWAGFGRGDCVVALGGGAAGDLAGFVAATYHRGIPLVQVPTTLLSQVDSSVGGKTAIDHPMGKNLIGAFHQPSLVVADLETLQTLPTRERWSGLAEMAKAALIADVSLLEELEANLERLSQAPATDHLQALVARAVALKAEVVAGDERDTGRRRILNFGHTLGHALEVLTGYGPLTHGEAVVLGMRGALHVSERLDGLPPREAERARRLLARFPIPPFAKPTAAEVLEAATRDKKREGDRAMFVTVGPLGEARVQAVERALLEEAIERMWDA